MADKTVEQPEVTVEETKKEKEVKEVIAAVDEEDDAEPETEATVEKEESENGDSKENGEAEKENGKEETNGDSTPSEADKCCIKRKSVGGEAKGEDAPADGATPEKKAKLDEPAEAESNGEAEVAA